MKKLVTLLQGVQTKKEKKKRSMTSKKERNILRATKTTRTKVRNLVTRQNILTVVMKMKWFIFLFRMNQIMRMIRWPSFIMFVRMIHGS